MFRYGIQRSDYLLFTAASGLRNNSDGTLNNVGTNGYNWSSSPNATNATRGSNLNFNSSSVNPANNNNRANGFPGRCVQELAMRKRSPP
ncbi:hypothetical protein [Bacteroides sp.]